MVKNIFAAILLMISIAPAYAVGMKTPTLDLEKKIAYQQGQFGALYARCGARDELTVIGGSLAQWKNEVFRGYQGSAEEHAALEREFDDAANGIHAELPLV